VCLTSNLQTGVVRLLLHHPLADLLYLDLRVTLNTDDPSVSDTTLTDEYQLALEALRLPPARLGQLIETRAGRLPARGRARGPQRAHPAGAGGGALPRSGHPVKTGCRYTYCSCHFAIAPRTISRTSSPIASISGGSRRRTTPRGRRRRSCAARPRDGAGAPPGELLRMIALIALKRRASRCCSTARSRRGRGDRPGRARRCGHAGRRM
jgi:hypothetical protein